MNSSQQARYYAQRAAEFTEPLVDDIVDAVGLEPDDLRARLALVDALTRAYSFGRRDGATEVVAQLQESDLPVECTIDVVVATGPLGLFSS